MDKTKRPAFTMIEMFMVVLIIGILVILLLPGVQAVRENARRNACSHNLAQVGLAVELYHGAFGQYPVQMHGTEGSSKKGADNDRRLSIFVALLPYIDNASLANTIRSGRILRTRSTPSGDDWMYDEYYEEIDAEEAEQAGESDASDSAEGVGERNTLGSDNGLTPNGQSDPITLTISFPPGGPEVDNVAFVPWVTETATLRCPSDPGYGTVDGFGSAGRINYAACLGDSIDTINSGPFREVDGKFVLEEDLRARCAVAMRGIFVPRLVTHRSDVSDGTSHTILLGEIATGLGDRDRRTSAMLVSQPNRLLDNPTIAMDRLDVERPDYWRDESKILGAGNGKDWLRGLRWCDGMPLFTSFQTILPPNSAMFAMGNRSECAGVFPSSSRHPGGINACFADGSVRFLSNTIDSGDQQSPTIYLGGPLPPDSRSPYGVWGAMGTRASGEIPFQRGD